MGTAATADAKGGWAGGGEARQRWTQHGWGESCPTQPQPQPHTGLPAALPGRCAATARDLLPLLEVAGLAVVLLDGAGRATTATPAVERLLGPDPERREVWRSALALADALRRAPAPGGAPASTRQCDVPTALATYRLTVLVPADTPLGSPSGWGAVTIQRVPGEPSDAWLRTAHGLSHREQQVARLLVNGCTNAQAAAQLGISAHTARHHAERVYEKLGVRCRAELGRVLGAAGGTTAG